MRGGFTGVDVFFVLSGFLITSVILPDIKARRFSLMEFYFRRIQRLVPNSVATIFGTVVLWWFFMPPSLTAKVAQHGLWTLGNLSNFFIHRNLGSYWDPAATASPLLHTWSLAVEEQFYFLFPGSLLLLYRLKLPRIDAWMALATALGFLFCIYEVNHHPSFAFYMLPTRVWELSTGVTLAIYMAHKFVHRTQEESPIMLDVLGGLGLVAVAGGFWIINEDHGFPSLLALMPTLGTAALIYAFQNKNGHFSRLFSLPIFVNIGKVSYSLYLWHWPLIVLGKHVANFNGYPSIWGAMAGALLGIGASIASYHWIEHPLRQRGEGRLSRLAIIGVGFCSVVGMTQVLKAWKPVAIAELGFAPIVHHFNHYNAAWDGIGKGEKLEAVDRGMGITSPPVPVDQVNAFPRGGVIKAYGSSRPALVVIGSSHALMYSQVIDQICKAQKISVAFLCVNGTPAFYFGQPSAPFRTINAAVAFDEARKKWVATWHPDAVLVIDRWDRQSDDLVKFRSDLRSFLKDVAPLSKHIILVDQAPVLQIGNAVTPLEYASWRLNGKGSLPRIWPDLKDPVRHEISSILEEAASRLPGARFLSISPSYYLPDGSIRYFQGRDFLYVDGDHLSDAGAAIVSTQFATILRETCGDGL